MTKHNYLIPCEFGPKEDCTGEVVQCNCWAPTGRCVNYCCEEHSRECNLCGEIICLDCTIRCEICGNNYCLKCAQTAKCVVCKKTFCSECGKLAGGKHYCNEHNPYYKETDKNKLTFERIEKRLRNSLEKPFKKSLPEDYVEIVHNSQIYDTEWDVENPEKSLAELERISELLDEVLDGRSQ